MLNTTHTPPRIILPENSFFEMLPIPPGSFMMGSNEEEAFQWEKPVHRVKIDYPFFLSKYPVSKALWLAVMGSENPSTFKGIKRPVEQVSWFDAAVFCNRLNELCGLQPVYFSDKHYRKPYGKKGDTYFLPNDGEVFINRQAIGFRLPNEVEWEYAARGISSTDESLQSDTKKYLKHAGSNKLDDVGWYGDNSHDETKPVGLKHPNIRGLHDMSGNVWEWCNDHWHSNYNKAPYDGSAWLEKKGDIRVLRGGAWGSDPLYCRVAYRIYYHPTYRSSTFGFRLVLVSIIV